MEHSREKPQGRGGRKGKRDLDIRSTNSTIFSCPCAPCVLAVFLFIVLHPTHTAPDQRRAIPCTHSRGALPTWSKPVLEGLDGGSRRSRGEGREPFPRKVRRTCSLKTWWGGPGACRGEGREP